ncbi:phospholipase D-like domain-containing protein [Psychromarinibacter sp. C21-152]|uniref:Phospholipase D n=1 Tax=Psychromarinibacter sediminicola TaxID=3033385 RepID=A0AAE3T8L8_9RHOB|nr:phospholipase D-like domain-containing protein [Psychromarinibacter sediminicola]MDF0600848.1 phospholipase D-like domain-containing protein [Psychromarinibacter sediminicola]
MDDAATPRLADPQILITAAEAYPAFERRVLAAEREVILGFRIFDPLTRLRSSEAREVGETWLDLLEHTLRRGVRVEIHLSDFDPIAATQLHALCWRSVRMLCALWELAGPSAGARLSLFPEIHPAKTGRIARIFFWPIVAAKMRQIVRHEETGAKPSHRRRVLKYLPGIAYLRDRYKGRPALSFPATHHHKLAVIDDRWLFIGGLDVNERRWDDWDHNRPAQLTWHDVQVLAEDPVRATSARRHLQTFNDAAAGRHEVVDAPGLLRTLARDQSRRRPWTMGPGTVADEIATCHREAIGRTEKLVYIETQFFRDRRIARWLARRGREEPDLKMILLLPGAPETVAFEETPKLDGRFGDFLQARCIRRIRRAFGKRLLIASPVQRRAANGVDMDADRATLRGAPIVYLHAKVSVFDDRLGLVSSANLNGRSLRWDTEAGIALKDPAQVAGLRQRLSAHWWPEVPGIDALPVDRMFGVWRRLLRENAAEEPDERTGFLVPYDRRAAEETAIALPGVPEEMV